jgi:hypothetical protein
MKFYIKAKFESLIQKNEKNCKSFFVAACFLEIKVKSYFVRSICYH